MTRNDTDKTSTPCNNVADDVVCHAQGFDQTTASSDKSARTKRNIAQIRQEITDIVRGRSEDTLWTLDPEVAWFDDQSVNTQSVTKKQGTYLVGTDENTPTKSRSAAVGASPRVFRFEWATLWRHLSCYRIANAHNLYLVWLLRTTSDQWMLWAGMHAPSTVLSYFREHRAELEAQARPVYVERLNGDPLGSYAGTLAHSQRALPALFIQMYGVRNGVPCQQCESSYRRYVRLDESGAVLARVMVPFFECISLPNFHNSCCGNCAYRIEAAKCSYHPSRREGLGGFVDDLIASPATETALGPRKLSPDTTPAIGLEMSADDVRNFTADINNRSWADAVEWE